MYMPHVERDTEEKPEQTLCEGDPRLMQAWSEEGTALVRGWCGSGENNRENYVARIITFITFAE